MLSPLAGRLTDRIGGKRAIIALFVIAGATFVLLGTAVAYAMLLVGALAGAFSQAAANPATNKMIAEELPAGERGMLTGFLCALLTSLGERCCRSSLDWWLGKRIPDRY